VRGPPPSKRRWREFSNAKEEEHVRHEAQQPGGAHGTLERRPLEDRDLRLLAFVVVAVFLGGAVGTKFIDPNAPGPGESGRMDEILDAGFKQPAGESVFVQHPSLRTTDPAFTAAIKDVVGSISELDAVQNVRSPQIAENGQAALVEFQIRGDADDAVDKIDSVLAKVDEAQKAHPEFFIGEFGDASSVKAVETAFADDLGKAGLLSLPITLVILVIAFGALVAAGIPLLLALTACLQPSD
jgi:putative drug exporter of the RND superfamily